MREMKPSLPAAVLALLATILVGCGSMNAAYAPKLHVEGTAFRQAAGDCTQGPLLLSRTLMLGQPQGAQVQATSVQAAGVLPVHSEWRPLGGGRGELWMAFRVPPNPSPVRLTLSAHSAGERVELGELLLAPNTRCR